MFRCNGVQDPLATISMFLSVRLASLVSSVSYWAVPNSAVDDTVSLWDEGLLMTVSSRTLRITWQGHVVLCISTCLTVPLQLLYTRSLLRNRLFLQETRSKARSRGALSLRCGLLHWTTECGFSETAAHVSRKATRAQHQLQKHLHGQNTSPVFTCEPGYSTKVDDFKSSCAYRAIVVGECKRISCGQPISVLDSVTGNKEFGFPESPESPADEGKKAHPTAGLVSAVSPSVALAWPQVSPHSFPSCRAFVDVKDNNVTRCGVFDENAYREVSESWSGLILIAGLVVWFSLCVSDQLKVTVANPANLAETGKVAGHKSMVYECETSQGHADPIDKAWRGSWRISIVLTSSERRRNA